MRVERNRRRRVTGREGGSVIVEAAILLPLLMLIFMGILDFGRMYYTKIGIENATREAGRFAVTGNTLADPGNPSKDLSREAGIREFLVDYLKSRFPSVKTNQLSVTLNPSNGGKPGQIIRISVQYPFQFVVPMIGKFFDNDTYVVRYTTVMKNEPIFTEKRRS